MKKRLISTFIVIVLLFSFCSVSFASTDDGNAGIVPYETHSVTFAINRTSATKATASVYVSFSQVVDRYSVVFYLQKYSNGEWVTDISNDNYVTFNNGWNKSYFLYDKTYTGLSRGTTYRLKCISKDYIGDYSYTRTTYSNTF